jgi:hypothetical protein
MSEDVRQALDKKPTGLKMNTTEKVLTGIIVGLIALFIIFAFVADRRFDSIEENQSQGQIRTYQTRALNCQILLSLGQKDQTGICTAKETTDFYSPDAVHLTGTGQIICDHLIEQAARGEATIPEGCR